MKWCTLVPAVSMVVLCSAPALAQDATKADPAHYKVVFENATVRVLKIDYAPGEKSKMHQHPDAIVVPLTTANMRFALADGKSEEKELAAGGALYTPAVTHTPENISKARLEALLVEFKTPAAGTAALPTTRPNMAMKVLSEGPRATAFHMTADAAFQEPAGSKHDYDQVVITLTPAKMSLAVEGKPAKTDWARGDVQFIGRGTPHESKNATGKPTEFIIIGIK
jgi:quercetin dioxygenase-like cupin family protein